MARDPFGVASAGRPRGCSGSRRCSGARASSAVLGMRKAHGFAYCNESDARQERAQGVDEGQHVNPSRRIAPDKQFAQREPKLRQPT